MPSDAVPIIAITMGDASGIGPEVVLKSLLLAEIFSVCRPVVIGDANFLTALIQSLGLPLRTHRVRSATEGGGQPGQVDILDLDNLDSAEVFVGKVCKACGKAAMEYLARAAELASAGEVGAIVTAPINKEATVAAGCPDIGHLEFLARVTKSADYATMLVSGRLRAVHLTTHHSLKKACDLVTADKILAKLRLTDRSFRQWGISRPVIGVAALNPHGGESGLFGSEETDQILPAVRAALDLGIDARGPFPADSVFNRAIKGEFHAVLAMYHDQGHIAVKVHGFEHSITVALGLPFIRTSVDHGTAFDIAGKGIADSRSQEEAIRMAASLLQGKL
jgi:4-phospho-D-threonate 3-dehydrogenase / 4-phospho-D-erythronate 3-dehydrogenase